MSSKATYKSPGITSPLPTQCDELETQLRPKGFDEFTGKELENSDQADFSIGIPITSVGFKISY